VLTSEQSEQFVDSLHLNGAATRAKWRRRWSHLRIVSIREEDRFTDTVPRTGTEWAARGTAFRFSASRLAAIRREAAALHAGLDLHGQLLVFRRVRRLFGSGRLESPRRSRERLRGLET